MTQDRQRLSICVSLAQPPVGFTKRLRQESEIFLVGTHRQKERGLWRLGCPGICR